ncbi:hypothetical protein F9K85_12100 [Brucella tritici]|nr:hypothetical protein F9K85_12100 [Brucella tritici]
MSEALSPKTVLRLSGYAPTVRHAGCPQNHTVSRAHFDLIESDRRVPTVYFYAHLIRRPFHTFRDVL